MILPSSFYKNGDIKAVWYWPNMDGDGKWLRSDIVPKGIPSFVDVYQKQFGKMPTGADWKAFKMTIEDDITRAEERKVLDFAYDYIDHEAAKKTLARLANADPKFVKY